MREAIVLEHISYQLCHIEFRPLPLFESYPLVKVDALSAEHRCGYEHQHIYYQQVFCHCGYRPQKRPSSIHHDYLLKKYYSALIVSIKRYYIIILQNYYKKATSFTNLLKKLHY